MSEIKLHLGCGSKHIPGYINIDLQDSKEVDLLYDITMIDEYYEENTVQDIYLCHVLEHFEKNKGEELLKKLYKILRPNGELQLSVPDFNAIVKRYNETHNLNELYGLLYGRHDIEYEGHYTIWDYETISSILIDIGFELVHEYDWKTSIPYINDATYDDFASAYLPAFQFDTGLLMSLNVKAIK